MNDFIEFLLARIAEDEATAHRATGGPWVTHGGSVDGARHQPVVMEGFDSAGYLAASCGDEDAKHIARWDPVRVLAECEAKRWMVETFGVTDHSRYNDPEIMRRLALPYADHPDCREEWKL